MLAEVEFSVGDDGVGPGFFFLVSRHERAFEFVAGGGGFDQGDVAALVAIDEVAVDIGDAGGSMTGSFDGAPLDFAGFEFDADGITAVVLVAAKDVTVDKDHAAVVVLESFGFEKINFLGRITIEFEKGRAGAVTGGAEDVIASDDGSGNVGGRVGDRIVGPEVLAVASADADDTASGHLDVLLHTTSIGNRDATISGSVFSSFSGFAKLGLPLGGAGFLVERHDKGVWAARSAEDAVTIDERRFREAPARHHFSVPFVFEVFGPNDFSFGSEADDSSVGSCDVEMAVTDSGNGTGSAVAMFGGEFGDGSLPEKFAVFGGKGADALAFEFSFKVASSVDDSIGNGDRGISFAGSFAVPEELGFLGAPVLDDSGFRRVTVSIGTTPLRPVFGLGERSQTKES